MTLAIIALALIGFVFPPAWLLMMGCAICLVASAKSRRASAVEDRLIRMLGVDQRQAEFSDLYYEAARCFAVEKGATLDTSRPDLIYVKLLLKGNLYGVCFSKARNGGTLVLVENHADVQRRVMAGIFA